MITSYLATRHVNRSGNVGRMPRQFRTLINRGRRRRVRRDRDQRRRAIRRFARPRLIIKRVSETPKRKDNRRNLITGHCRRARSRTPDAMAERVKPIEAKNFCGSLKLYFRTRRPANPPENATERAVVSGALIF